MEEMGGEVEVNRLQNVALARAYTPLSNARMEDRVSSQPVALLRHYDRA
jgi:hypothetical protein